MSEAPHLLVEQDGPVLIATLNWPEKLNAMTQEMMDLFRAALLEFRDTPELKVMLVRATGRYFCAGADLKGGKGPAQMTASGIRENHRLGVYGVQSIYDEMEHIEKPIVVAHLNYLHGGDVQYYENQVDGVYYRQRQSVRGSRSDTGPEWDLNPGVTSSLTETDHHTVSTVNAYYGVGINAARFAEIGAAELIGATPIENGTCRVWQGAMVKAPGGVVNDDARAFARRINDMFSAGLGVHDGEVWATKRPATRIMQLPTDGPFGQARIWYSQFFNPRSKAEQIIARVVGVHRVKGVPGATQN